jgi:hypothetical protein
MKNSKVLIVFLLSLLLDMGMVLAVAQVLTGTAYAYTSTGTRSNI